MLISLCENNIVHCTGILNAAFFKFNNAKCKNIEFIIELKKIQNKI